MTQAARPLIQGSAALVIMGGQESCSPIISQLIDAARRQAVPVIFAISPTVGHDPALALAPDDAVIRPRRCSVFYGTDLSILARERAIQTLILAGGITSVGVHYSFVDAHQNDFFCRVVEDSMSGSSPAAHDAALRAMEYMQTGARRSSQAVLAALAAVGIRARTRGAEGTP